MTEPERGGSGAVTVVAEAPQAGGGACATVLGRVRSTGCGLAPGDDGVRSGVRDDGPDKVALDCTCAEEVAVVTDRPDVAVAAVPGAGGGVGHDSSCGAEGTTCHAGGGAGRIASHQGTSGCDDGRGSEDDEVVELGAGGGCCSGAGGGAAPAGALRSCAARSSADHDAERNTAAGRNDGGRARRWYWTTGRRKKKDNRVLLAAPVVRWPWRRARHGAEIGERVFRAKRRLGEDVRDSDTESCSDSEDVMDPRGGGAEKDGPIRRELVQGEASSVHGDAGESKSVDIMSRSSWRRLWRLRSERARCI